MSYELSFFLFFTLVFQYPHCLAFATANNNNKDYNNSEVQQQKQQQQQEHYSTKTTNTMSDTIVADEASVHLAPWAERWSKQRIGFHLDEVNPILQRNVNELLGTTSTATSSSNDEGDNSCSSSVGRRRVLFPLCGKTVDMPFLVSRTSDVAKVVGIDGIRKAFEDFALEHPNLKVELKEDKKVENTSTNGFERWEGENITLLRGDFFNLERAKDGGEDGIGKFDAIFDRGSLVAIQPEMRSSYVTILGKIIEKNGRILLVALHRIGEPEAEQKGPPFSLSETDVRELFGGQEWVESITVLEQHDQLEEKPEDRERYAGLDKLLETAFLIQAKA